MSILSPKMVGLLVTLIIVGLIGSSCTVVPAAPMPAAEMPAEEMPAEEMPAETAATMPEADVSEFPLGSGPDLAMQPTDQWMELKSGEYHWYAVHFDYDEDLTEPVEIKIWSDPPKSAVLTVRNEQQANMWRLDGEHEHFGCCVVEEREYGFAADETPYAVWRGMVDTSGTFYIVVEHARNIEMPAVYRFEITGEGFSMPEELYTAKAPAAPPAAMPMIEAAAAPVEAMILTGGGPDEALTPTDAWVQLDEGQYQWYAFNYDFDEDYTQPLEIKIWSDPPKGAVLTVRNEQQADMWRRDGEHLHFGCCVVEEREYGFAPDETPYAIWRGELGSSGKYYMVVEHAKNVTGPVYYRFTMTGEGFSY